MRKRVNALYTIGMVVGLTLGTVMLSVPYLREILLNNPVSLPLLVAGMVLMLLSLISRWLWGTAGGPKR